MRRVQSLAVCVLRFQHVAIEQLEERLAPTWKKVGMEPAGGAQGILTFSPVESSEKSNATCAVVNSSFVELRTNAPEPIKTLEPLAEAVLTEPAIRLVGLVLDTAVVLENNDLPALNMAAALARPVNRLVSDFARSTRTAVDAIGLRLFLRDPNRDGYYTFDISPHVDHPQRQIVCRLKSRVGESDLDLDRFGLCLRSHWELQGQLTRAAPEILLNGPGQGAVDG